MTRGFAGLAKLASDLLTADWVSLIRPSAGRGVIHTATYQYKL